MTVPEAQERLEALTVTLASCANSLKQRGAIEVKMARCYRIIQRAQQRAHQSLASVATVLLEVNENVALNEQETAAIVAAAHLIRCASTEQLAVAVPAALHETSTDGMPPIPNRFPEFSSIVSSLVSLGGPRLPLEERLAIYTALRLMDIAERPQIRRSMRQAQTCAEALGPNGIFKRLTEIYTAHHPQRRQKLGVKARSGVAPPLDEHSRADSFR